MSAPEKPSGVVVFAMTVIAVAAIAAATTLIMTGHGVGDLMAVLVAAGLPVLSYMGARIHSGVQQNNVLANGNNSKLADAVIELAKAKTPAATPAPADIVPTDTP